MWWVPSGLWTGPPLGLHGMHQVSWASPLVGLCYLWARATNSFMLPPFWLSGHDGCALELCDKINLTLTSLLKGYFIRTTRKETKTIIFPRDRMNTFWNSIRYQRDGDREKASSMHEVPFQSSSASPKMWEYFPYQESRWASKQLHICLGNIFSLEFWRETETGSAEVLEPKLFANSNILIFISNADIINKSVDFKMCCLLEPGPLADVGGTWGILYQPSCTCLQTQGAAREGNHHNKARKVKDVSGKSPRKVRWRRQPDDREDVMMTRPTSGTPHRMPQRHRQVLERNTLLRVPSTLLRHFLGLEIHTST